MEFNISPEFMPRHIAIIMDGNGRWAKQKILPRVWGHKEGSQTVRRITEECVRLKIKQLTLYAFSSENWQRPKEEVDYLMDLLRRFLIQERNLILNNNIRLTYIGRTSKIPPSTLEELKYIEEISKKNTGMVLCLALSYGGREEIIDAVKAIARKVISGEISVEQIQEDTVDQHLYQPNMPCPDLLIRTGGEMRLSNFLLWQVSYTELWVTPLFWPEFQITNLHQAILDFSKRERRFGKVPCLVPHQCLP